MKKGTKYMHSPLYYSSFWNSNSLRANLLRWAALTPDLSIKWSINRNWQRRLPAAILKAGNDVKQYILERNPIIINLKKGIMKTLNGNSHEVETLFSGMETRIGYLHICPAAKLQLSNSFLVSDQLKLCISQLQTCICPAASLYLPGYKLASARLQETTCPAANL